MWQLINVILRTMRVCLNIHAAHSFPACSLILISIMPPVHLSLSCHVVLGEVGRKHSYISLFVLNFPKISVNCFFRLGKIAERCISFHEGLLFQLGRISKIYLAVDLFSLRCRTLFQHFHCTNYTQGGNLLIF